MSWLETPEQRRRQHLQMVATGHIRDIDRIQERDRKRKINSIFWFLFVVSTVLSFLSFKGNFNNAGFYLLGFSVLMLIILIFRYGLQKKIKLRKKKSEWEKLRHLPN